MGDINILGYDLIRDRGSYYERYDVLKNGKQVGYLRLRYGGFTAEVPDFCGETVYEADSVGDSRFEDDERMHFLTEAVKAIDAHYKGVL